MLHTYLDINVALARRKSVRSLGTVQKAMLFGNQRKLGANEIIKLDVKKTGFKWFRVAFHC
jgi:hypothetical protein